MIPTFTGSIASSFKLFSYSSIVYADCNLNSPTTVYAPYPGILKLNDQIFLDKKFKVPYISESFFYGMPTSGLSTDITGMLTSYNGTCYAALVVDDSCSPTASFNIYLLPGTSISNGSTAFIDQTLLVKYNNHSFVYGGTNYSTDNNGIITKGNVCNTSYDAYADCTLDSYTPIYTTFGTNFGVGITIYSDPNLTIPYANTNFVEYDSSLYSYARFTTDSSGVVSQLSPLGCPAYITTVYNSCNTNSVVAKLRSSSPIQPGTVVYTDDALTTPFTSQTFYVSAGVPIIQYTTNGSGEIGSGTYCYKTWGSCYSTCNDYRDNISPYDIYTHYSVSTLTTGVTAYTDTSLTIPATGFTRNGVYYNISEGVINNTIACIYSLPYTTLGCGLANDSILYTRSVATTLYNLYLAGAILYSDENLLTVISSSNIYKNGETIYLTTDYTGQVISYSNCPT